MQNKVGFGLRKIEIDIKIEPFRHNSPDAKFLLSEEHLRLYKFFIEKQTKNTLIIQFSRLKKNLNFFQYLFLVVTL